MMYYLIFILVMITPLSLLAIGLCWRISLPKRDGTALAYRTELSVCNQETWQFAHQHLAKLWVRIGLISTIVVTALMVAFSDYYWSFFLWLIGGEMAFLCISAFLVDNLLKATFDEQGEYLL